MLGFIVVFLRAVRAAPVSVAVAVRARLPRRRLSRVPEPHSSSDAPAVSLCLLPLPVLSLFPRKRRCPPPSSVAAVLAVPVRPERVQPCARVRTRALGTPSARPDRPVRAQRPRRFLFLLSALASVSPRCSLIFFASCVLSRGAVLAQW